MYSVVQSCTELYIVVKHFTELYQVVQGFTEFYSVALLNLHIKLGWRLLYFWSGYEGDIQLIAESVSCQQCSSPLPQGLSLLVSYLMILWDIMDPLPLTSQETDLLSNKSADSDTLAKVLTDEDNQ